MSFIDTLVKGVGNFAKSNSIGAQLAKTALYGFALNKAAKSIQKQQDKNSLKDQGVTVSVNPDPKNTIPVIYGSAFTSGLITDAYMQADKRTMWFCITLSEMTGNLIDGTASDMEFMEVYYSGLRLDFKADGYTVDIAYDDSGNNTNKFSGLIEVYPFVDGSDNPAVFITEGTGNTSSAYSLFPTWTSANAMSGLVFALIKIKYDAKQKISSINDFKFKIRNTMTQPGDVLYDYMTNTRYGAGIPAAEINVS